MVNAMVVPYVRAEEQAIAYSCTYPLRKEKLPILGRDGCHEDPDELQDGTDEKGRAKVSGVCQTPGKGAYEKEHEYLHGPDP